MNCFLLALMVVFLSFSNAAFAQSAGTRDYNTSSKRYQYYDGSQWKNFRISLTLGVCAQEAQWDYNNVLNLYQYCNGTFWVKIIGTPRLAFCSKTAEMEYSGGTYLYCNGVVWVDIGEPSFISFLTP